MYEEEKWVISLPLEKEHVKSKKAEESSKEQSRNQWVNRKTKKKLKAWSLRRSIKLINLRQTDQDKKKRKKI